MANRCFLAALLRICGVCFKQGNDLVCCKDCDFVYTCSDYHFNKNHNKWCPTLKLYHEIVRHLEKEIVLPHSNLQIATDVESMAAIMETIPAPNSEILSAITSELLTYPLTVLRGLKNIPPSETFTIHIVGAELQAEVLPWSKWENYLLHLLPACQQINLIFVGPDLKEEASLEENAGVCVNCRETGKKLNFQLISGTVYHDYLALPRASKPDLITALNAGLYRSIGFKGLDSWSLTLEKLFGCGGVPVLVTEYTSCEMSKDLELIKKRYPDVQLLQGPEMNPFASIRPNLNLISDQEVPVIFKNYFSMVLSSIKVS